MSEHAHIMGRLQVLADFGDFTLHSDNLDDILTEACRLVADALGTSRAKILEIQEKGQSLLVRAGVGWGPGIVGHTRLPMAERSSETFAIKAGEPVISQDISKEDRFELPPFLKEAGVVALANVPIFLPGRRAFGLLQVDAGEPRTFGPEDTQFLRTYATVLGPVIDRLLQVRDLRESQERFRLTVEAALDYAIFVADPQDRITDWLPGAEAVFGWTAAEAVGQPSAIIFTPEDRESGQDRKEAEMACAEGTAPNVRWHIRKDGLRVFIEGSTRALRDADGRLTGFLKIGQDVTGRRAAEERLHEGEAALRRLNETLETQVEGRTAELTRALGALQVEVLQREQAEQRLLQSEKLKAIGQLTGGIAHDFNNMLQAITSALSMVRLRAQQGRPADVAGYVDRAEIGAKRAAALTHRLLAFGRQQTLAPKLVNVDQIARDMEDMIRRSVGPAIQVELELAGGRWLVMCDPGQLENALLNLCVNARDAMPDGGWLVITTEELVLSATDVANAEEAQPGRYAAIAVSDTGTGMTPEVAARVFEPFFTTKPLGHGTGLGLSQIYGFIRQSGGIVQLETAPGKGTVVRLCLPFHALNPDSEAIVTADLGRTVLLVEDEPDVREMTAEQLRELGYRVLEAQEGAAALRLVQAGAHLDLLVSDVGLPGGMNGRQLADLVRERHPDLPVILITGYAAGQEMSGMEVVHKPFDPVMLAELVRAKLDAL
ncbi:MAG: PAS domain S-box protein [Janthinobacterium lividum]